MFLVRVFTPVLIIFIASQIYWLLRARTLAWKFVRTTSGRVLLGAAALIVYLGLLAVNFEWLGRGNSPTRMTPFEALLVAPFLWWVFSSIVAFLVVMLFRTVRIVAGLTARKRRKSVRAAESPASESRRQFLERTSAAASAAPFLAGAYGLLYGRLNLETTETRIRLPRLPRAFEGFRIGQLSDIHIGPFMSDVEIRKYVRIANALKPDLFVLTGDFITWDPSTQQAVVDVLAGLKAPFGIFGCLGNHEVWSRTEDSITSLFAHAGIRILRQARVPVTTRGEALNLIGVDYASGPLLPRDQTSAQRYLEGVETLIQPHAANILLSHTPATFDRAAELGIDLSLAGHTHGGQVALEFVSPELAPSRLMTPYVSGWFEKPGGQLYVNRGIGTVGAPMRIGAPPEIAVFQLVRS